MKRILAATLALMLLAGPASGWPWRRRAKKEKAPAASARPEPRRSNARLSGQAWTGPAGLAALLANAGTERKKSASR